MKRRDFIAVLAAATCAGMLSRNAVAETVSRKSTAYLTSPVFLQHHISADHPESPERIRTLQNTVLTAELSPGLIQPAFQSRSAKWLNIIHSTEHIDSIQTNSPVAYKVASAAVDACLEAVDLVIAGRVRNAFCASRPPGHHALNTGREEGFCYFNQIAIAARYAQKLYKLEKVLIVDWDYHHGNATELAFYDDPSVLFFSSHDRFAYPGTGAPDRKGVDRGLGYNINIHLPCDTEDREIVAVYEQTLVTAANSFKPDLVLVSAGFDSRRDDLLGCFKVSDSGFQSLTRIVMQIAEDHCDGRLVSILEGGYNLPGNASAALAHLTTLLNSK
ncbi:MAG: histone deacetylase [Gammaproteobacteria bacterium]|nr:histone deacetylase [Gammaproteobacteria bacterium]